jgi:hypothetical protein
MPFTFVSHASEDKRYRVKPLVEALLLLGVRLWLDRPGYGESHFGFDQDFIQLHRIRSLRAGLDFREQINSALSECGAVLVCISRALCAQRQVLVQELVLGHHHHKLVACIVDDIPYSEIPQDLGLVNTAGLQAERIDPAVLRVAVDRVRQTGSLDGEHSSEVVREWERVRKLFADIKAVYRKLGLNDPSSAELDEAVRALGDFPVYPAVRFDEIPMEIIMLYSAWFDDQQAARGFFRTAMQLSGRCNPEGCTDEQIIVFPGEVLDPRTVTAVEFWTDLFACAGRKSRRTLAALLLTPGAPSEDAVRPEEASVLRRFKKWLASPK